MNLRAVALASAALLTSCSQASAVDETEIAQMRQHIATLENQVQEQGRQIGYHKVALEHYSKQIDLLSSSLDSLTGTVNGNARASNANAVRHMTESGVCGTESYVDDLGWRRVRNKNCTTADLSKGVN